jgi:hypothetical protein
MATTTLIESIQNRKTDKQPILKKVINAVSDSFIFDEMEK